MSKVSNPARAYSARAAAATSRSSGVPPFSRSATCQSPQTRRLAERPSGKVQRSGMFGIGQLSSWILGRPRFGPLVDMARDDAQFAQYAAWPEQQDGTERDADEDDLQRRGAGLVAGGHDRGDHRARRRPDAPDQHRAKNSAAIVAGAADD